MAGDDLVRRLRDLQLRAEALMQLVKASLATLILLALSVSLGIAAGTAVVVDPDAIVRSAGQQRTLLAGDAVGIGDLIQTANNGHVELAFDDGTKIVVGPGSALLIEDYLLRGDGSVGDFAANALGGTFRFISGKSPNDRYRITTPTGTIGIRGTEFDLVAERGRRTQVLMYSGSTELCSVSGECTVIADVCELGEINSSGAISLGLTTRFDREERKELRSQFVYGGSQQSLGASHKLRAAGKCLLSPFGLLQLRNRVERRDSAVVENRPAEGPGAQIAVPSDDPIRLRPVTADDDGDCAGNSGQNPGNSQNCKK
jgi:hypothetical protein